MTVTNSMHDVNHERGLMFWRRCGALAAALLIMTSTTGCASNFFSHDGPRYASVATVPREGRGALLVDVNDGVARQVSAPATGANFLDVFGSGQAYGALIGPGDVLQLTIFEAPPAVLFVTPSMAGASIGINAGSGQRGVVLPDMQVDGQGEIEVPFAGRINVLGRTPAQVSADIVRRLRGKAHRPQVVVNIAKGTSSVVTVVGEVAASTRMPLTSQGERLLDALAAAGGSRQPVDKVSVQLMRDGKGVEMPLDALIATPGQNIYLRPGDVVTVSYQPASFTALGATGRNEEIKFEARGISLAQALGRMGGLRDDRANPRGVFIFRLEKPEALGSLASTGVAPDADGRVPVIYRVDLRDPVSFFTAQHFAMKDRDVVYVTNAPVADLQKFVSIIGAAVYPIVTVQAAGF